MDKENNLVVKFEERLNLEKLEKLINMGLYPIVINGCNGLEWLIDNKHIDIARMVEPKGIYTIAHDLSEMLRDAVSKDEVERAEYLLNNGVKPTVTAAKIALDNGNYKLAKLMIQILEKDE